MCRILTLFQIRSHTLRSKLFAEKNPTEIHGALSELGGEFTVDPSRISRWTNNFHGGCVNIDNDPRPGRPKPSTVERSVTFVTDAFEGNRRATCE